MNLLMIVMLSILFCIVIKSVTRKRCISVVDAVVVPKRPPVHYRGMREAFLDQSVSNW